MGNSNRDRGGRGGQFFGRGGFGRKNFDRGGGGSGRRDRQMFNTTCSNCGKDCQVPFKPTNSKPVYCDDCFPKFGGRDGGRNRNDRRQGGQGGGNNTALLESINKKLDKLIEILGSGNKNESVEIDNKPKEEMKEVEVFVKEELKENTNEPEKEIEKPAKSTPKTKKITKKKPSDK